ncbi:amidase [Pseudomonas rubra]|uniref:Amidase n=1 Tax=Pseudomonas rubra TaxID=2942627 RepID=A0ABT5PAJ5_9PSED|nr:amidase [Pseudomonas rubra]MDD1015329.1 amidase [Pseudomonas rubra]MDD1039551.1 amidase [Pseudomonas rubra]MDD1154023.1 amidase [Pseudomonas rubra]
MKRVGLVLILLAGAWGWYERQALADFPGILSAYSAKEYCSCRYVMNFDPRYCRGYVQQYLPLSRLDEDAQQRLISAEGLGVISQAQWQGPHVGCRLLP